jgi:DNA-binding LytR/AlgR family response regulator
LSKSFFIINDDKKTSDNLIEVFKEYPEFTCLGVTEDYEYGMNLILKLNPSVVFINLDSTGNENCRNVFTYCDEIINYSQQEPLFIALSANTSKAYYALKNRFYDYILKPGKELEIRKTILKLIKGQKKFLDDTICLKSYKDYTLLHLDEILFLQADNNATDFWLVNGRKISAFKTLKCFETFLPPDFIRIHHSYIVNKNYINRINFGKLQCFLNHNSTTLPFSKSYRHNLQPLENLLAQKAMSLN